MQISSKPVVFDAHLKRGTNTFHVPFYSVYMVHVHNNNALKELNDCIGGLD